MHIYIYIHIYTYILLTEVVLHPFLSVPPEAMLHYFLSASGRYASLFSFCSLKLCFIIYDIMKYIYIICIYIYIYISNICA